MCVHFEGACLEKITSSDVSELLMCGSHFQRLIAYFLFRMRCIHNRFLSTNQMPRQAGEQTNGDEVRGNTGA
ncbi:hypothetical protein A245_19401, partial [Pseudomonas syringae pv. actinidiae ICMP 19096]